MLIITKDMWSHVIAEDPDFIERLKNRLTIKQEATKDGEQLEDIILYRELIKGFSLDIPTGIVDNLVLPYVQFETVYDERLSIDVDLKELASKVNQTYKEMSEASPGFEVRQHQVMGTMKCLVNKHGIIEAATGCFSGSTQIETDLGVFSIFELVKDYTNKRIFCSDKKLHTIMSVHVSKMVKDTIEIIFSDNSYVECTPDHRFMLIDGTYKEAVTLTSDDELMCVRDSLKVNRMSSKHYLVPIPVFDIEVDSMLHNFALYNGVVVHNSGKTEIIASLLKLIPGKILIINNRTNILNQIEGRAKLRGITRNIEYLNKNPDLKNSDVIISTNNLIWNKIKECDKDALEYLKSLQGIIIDECHHSSCQSISVPVMLSEPEYLIGFTASPHKEGGYSVDDILLNTVLGNSIYKVSSQYLRDCGYSAQVYSYYVDYPAKKVAKRCNTCAAVYKEFVAENFNRNEAALRVIKNVYDKGLKSLVMVSRIEHGCHIIRELKAMGIKSLFMCGGNTIYEASDELEKVKGLERYKVIKHKGNANDIKKAIREDNYRVIVGNVVFNEGIDVPEFDVGILMDAGKNIISHIQRIGRVCRRKDKGLNCSVFVDFNDKGHPILQSWVNDRKQHLKKEGIQTITQEQFNKLINDMGVSRYE